MTTEREQLEMRMKTAADVIARIRLQKIVPTAGHYIGFKDNSEFRTHALVGDEDQQVKELLATKKCDVCALGAMFVSAVDRRNSLKMEELENYMGNRAECISDYDITSYLEQWFDFYQLALIECSFEGDDVQAALESRDGMAAEAFRDRVRDKVGDDDSELMLAIMRNIIKNKGEFIPEPQDYEVADKA
jgi:hypothetical protein